MDVFVFTEFREVIREPLCEVNGKGISFSYHKVRDIVCQCKGHVCVKDSNSVLSVLKKPS